MTDTLPMGAYERPTLPYTSFVAVRRQSDQTIANATPTAIDFLSGAEVEEDTDGMFSASASTRLTVTKPGVYIVVGNVTWTGNADGRRDAWIYKNGSSVAPKRVQPLTGISTIFDITYQGRLAIGDYIQFYVQQTSGGNLDAVAGAGTLRLSAMRVMG